MHHSGTQFPQSAAGFANQVILLYAETLGPWSKPLIGIAAFTVMFSTTLTVIDGFPRALATLWSRFQGPERPDRLSPINNSVYWVAVVILGLGASVYVLDHDLDSPPHKRSYARVQLRQREGRWRARSSGGQASHLLTSVVGADGLAEIPEDVTRVAAGEALTVHLLVEP